MSTNQIPADKDIDFDKIAATEPSVYRDATYVDPEKNVAHLKVWINSDIVCWLTSLPGKIDLNVNDILQAVMEKHKSGDPKKRKDVEAMLLGKLLQ